MGEGSKEDNKSGRDREGKMIHRKIRCRKLEERRRRKGRKVEKE